MKKLQAIFIILIVAGVFSCGSKKQSADLVVYNATIYTVDSAFTIKQAMAIKDGKILETGTREEIRQKYEAKESLDADGKTIFPGFIDAHCHFYAYGKGLQEIDLVGTKSWDEVIKVAAIYRNRHSAELYPLELHHIARRWVLGRGWDQNDWPEHEYPTKEKLDSIFPFKAVLLMRIDGHAAIVNSKALEAAGFTVNTKIKGGELIVKDNQLTGVLIDNAVDSIKKFMPPVDIEVVEKALQEAQKNCFEVGLTTVDDAGLEKEIVDIIDRMNKSNKLKMRIYAMLTPTKENLQHYLSKGIYKTDRLNVRSFKFYGDGALGSRGACLSKDYSDKPGWKGFLLHDIVYYDAHAKQMEEKGFQMNTHCIGDSAAKVILDIYTKHLAGKKDCRWRIEHAQVLDVSSFAKFGDNIVPSVQPTHATSDMYWATERLGHERIKNAYAYLNLLQQTGAIALGTDFPVEDISPFKTFYAAVVRKDAKGYPEGGFQMENALSREQALRGMTIWAAWSNFEEKEKGSLEPGKFADFVILDTDLMKCTAEEMLKTKVLSTYVGGERVFGVNKN
jgi:hypothetical protein